MSVLILNSSLVTLGGGERYTFALADVLSERHDVVIGTKTLPERSDLERRGFPTGYEIRSIPNDQYRAASRTFDMVIQTRLSPPLQGSLAPRSVVVVQFPAFGVATPRQPRAYYLQRRAMRTFDTYITYSEFCSSWIQKRWQRDSAVIPPPAKVGGPHGSTRHGILSISRFDPTKRHDALIEAYKALPPRVREASPLHLVGGLDESGLNRKYFDDLRRSAEGYNIVFDPNASQTTVDAHLASAQFFWHAKGFNRPADQPELAEHFGIVAAEAMGHGVVPLVVNDGGLTEIVDADSGVLWNTTEELAEATTRLVDDRAEYERLAGNVVGAAARFSTEAFNSRVRTLLF